MCCKFGIDYFIHNENASVMELVFYNNHTSQIKFLHAFLIHIIQIYAFMY